jgi:O-acetyl-ADP-ribose deacetylase
MTTLEAIRADITRLDVDAIVNAANKNLLAGAGVSGAIHAAAGPELEAECRQIGRCDTGQAVVTKGYRLPARYVIHTVGPVWNANNVKGGTREEDVLLASCYRASLELADLHSLQTIAFPSISTGIFGFPVDRAAPIAIAATREYLATHPASALTAITWACFDSHTLQAYLLALGNAAQRS